MLFLTLSIDSIVFPFILLFSLSFRSPPSAPLFFQGLSPWPRQQAWKFEPAWTRASGFVCCKSCLGAPEEQGLRQLSRSHPAVSLSFENRPPDCLHPLGIVFAERASLLFEQTT